MDKKRIKSVLDLSGKQIVRVGECYYLICEDFKPPILNQNYIELVGAIDITDILKDESIFINRSCVDSLLNNIKETKKVGAETWEWWICIS